jgi:hypothetical protein
MDVYLKELEANCGFKNFNIESKKILAEYLQSNYPNGLYITACSGKSKP